ncbi:MAG: nitroreductase [Deltaproteobacteria bacterium]|nr:nitroreductase [Deltaproteobacteria bacterium]
MTNDANGKKKAVCNTCTLKLVAVAYRRAPWFRLFREPLKLGMRFFSWAYRVDPSEYDVRTPACHGCIRFYKVALKEKSGPFRLMNDLFNPLFDVLLERIVTEEEVSQAKTYARAASNGEVTPDAAARWMKGQRAGFSCMRE